MTENLEKEDALNLHANPIYVNKEEQMVQVWKAAWDVKNNKYFTLDEIVKMIANRELDKTIIEMREVFEQYVETGDLEIKKKYDSIKPNLPLVTFSSNFDSRRVENHLINYTGYVIVDIDLKENPDLPVRIESLKRELKDCPYVCLMFDSPSGKGNGLKLVFKEKLNKEIFNYNNELKVCKDAIRRKELIDIIKDFQAKAHKQIREYFNNKYDFVIDECAKNFQGVCYLSADKDIYYNPNSSEFNIFWTYCPAQKQVINYNISINCNLPSYELMDKIINQFFKGEINGRNCTVFNLAMQVKYYGVTQSEVIQYAMNRFGASDFNEKEIRRCVQNAFKNEYVPINQFIINQSNNENIA